MGKGGRGRWLGSSAAEVEAPGQDQGLVAVEGSAVGGLEVGAGRWGVVGVMTAAGSWEAQEEEEQDEEDEDEEEEEEGPR